MTSAAVLIAVRFVLYLDLMLVFGLPLFSLYTPGGAEQPATYKVISLSAAAVLALAGAALSILGLLLLAANMSDVPVFQVDHETLNALVNGTAVGTAGKFRVVAILAALPVTALLRARPRFSLTALSCLGAVALGSLAWNGHGAADEGARGLTHLIADIGHLLGAGLWIGALAGLLVLLVQAREIKEDRHSRVTLAHRALVRFSSLGTFAVALIILTGLVNSWLLVGLANFSSLAGSLYGRLLILKLVIFSGMLSLASLNRWNLTPAVERGLSKGDASSALRSISWSVALEASLALVVLGLVAWLGTLAPPASLS